MARPKNLLNLFAPAKVPKQYQTVGAGGAGYDNIRENIDPHIKTKVLNSKNIIADNIVLGDDKRIFSVDGVNDVTGNLTTHRGTNTSNVNIISHSASDNAAICPRHLNLRADGTEQSPAIVTDGDILGCFASAGFDGVNYDIAGLFGCQVDGTPGLNSMPGRFSWALTPTGSINPVEKMRLTSTGRLGIGTTNPDSSLHLDSTAASKITLSRNTTSISSGSGLGVINFGGEDADSGPDYNAAIITVQARETWTNTNHGTNMFFNTTPNGTTTTAERMRIDQNGNIGIGTSLPEKKLTIKSGDIGGTNLGIGNTSSGNANIFLDASNGDFAGADYAIIAQDNTTLDLSLQTTVNAGDISFTAGSNTKDDQVVIKKGTGRVGIGTTAPWKDLSISGTTNPGISIGDSSSIFGGLSWNSTDDYLLMSTNNHDYPIRIGQNSLGGLFIDTDTNGAKVGIGTSTPQEILEVSSTVDARILIRDPNESIGTSAKLTFVTGSGILSGANFIAGINSIITQATPSALKGELIFYTNPGDTSIIAARMHDDAHVEFPGGIDIGSNGVILKKKVIEIGDWNMDSTGVIFLNHGLTLSKIRTISGMIRNDLNSTYYPISQGTSSGGVLDSYISHINSTIISLIRRTGGTYDNTSFDSTSYNRGWITIEYEA